MVYESTTPLKINGSFQADITIGQEKNYATFYVIHGETKNLLKKNTAISLGVLHLGTRINTQSRHFQNLKIYLLISP